MTITDTIRAGLDAIRINTKDVLTLDEAAIYTGLSVAYLYHLTSAKEIPHYKNGRRNVFKRSELDAWMTATKVHTSDEQRRRADIYDRQRRQSNNNHV